MEQQTTTVTTEEINLDDILGTPGAESIVVPSDNKKVEEKPSIFTSSNVDLSFLNEEKQEEVEDPENKTIEPNRKEEVVKIDELINEVEKSEFDAPPTPQNPVVFKKLLEKGLIATFEDKENIDDYTDEELEELFEANLKHKEEVIQERVIADFFESLPEELKYATKYVADGGQDIKGLFRALIEAEETKSFNVEKEDDQKQIIKQYLTATNWGTEDEIEEEILDLLDRGSLKSKAEKFKPKLDEMQEKVIEQKLAKQEELRQKKEESAKRYMQNIHKTISKGELSGVKLDQKTQALLFNGLVQPSYPSISGKPTNLLGHLLEKYQYVEPNHDLIAEVLWHLADPDGFKSKIQSIGSTKEKEEVRRQLKAEEATKNNVSGSRTTVIEDRATRERLPRKEINFFKR